MTAAEQVGQFTGGQAIGVDVASIERELAELWRQTAEGDVAVSRACLWNLIVFTDSDAAYQRAQRLVLDIAIACPARVLMLKTSAPQSVAVGASGTPVDPAKAVGPLAQSGSGDGAPVRAWISANCQIAPGGGKLLCSEEVTLESSPGGEEHLPPLVRALQVPDVPTALLWLGPTPTDPRLVKQVLAGADRLVIDTGDLTANPSSGVEVRIANLSRLLSSLPSVEVADLGWLRLGPLRLLLASFFDAPVGPAPLLAARRVRLDCSEQGTMTAMLMLGWLASRLGWSQPVYAGSLANEKSSAVWTSTRPDGQVRVELAVRPGDAGRDGIFHLEIESARGELFSVSDVGREKIELRGAGLPTRVLAAPERSDPELLVAALGLRGHDPLFAVTLQCAAQLQGGAP